ncbi:hypothetical protein CT0861_07462 [Colletotrichum tofieldiae]|uniref:Uncharacterized protein n=1 Tax=Colletotrichum tofieldiae TaxID=708197 RepID=A0A166MAX1_9PEZI|nr:hypothetical protein CT0861_07462 [Colletotrichum tofieldiae]
MHRRQLDQMTRLENHIATHARQTRPTCETSSGLDTMVLFLFDSHVLPTLLRARASVLCPLAIPWKVRCQGSEPPVRPSPMSQRQLEPPPTSVSLDSPDPDRPVGSSRQNSPKDRDRIRPR